MTVVVEVDKLGPGALNRHNVITPLAHSGHVPSLNPSRVSYHSGRIGSPLILGRKYSRLDERNSGNPRDEGVERLFPLIKLHPAWLEVAGVSLGGFYIVSMCFVYIRGGQQTINAVALAGRNRYIEYVKTEWRHFLWGLLLDSCVYTPLLEEILFRGLPVWLVQTGHLSWAIPAGLVLNVPYALRHRNSPSNWPGSMVAAIPVGFGLLAVSLVTGLLAAAIAAHALLNLPLWWRDYRAALAASKGERLYTLSVYVPEAMREKAVSMGR